MSDPARSPTATLQNRRIDHKPLMMHEFNSCSGGCVQPLFRSGSLCALACWRARPRDRGLRQVND